MMARIVAVAAAVVTLGAAGVTFNQWITLLPFATSTELDEVKNQNQQLAEDTYPSLIEQKEAKLVQVQFLKQQAEASGDQASLEFYRQYEVRLLRELDELKQKQGTFGQ